MAEKCLKCFRPIHTCYCSYIQPIKTPVKFVFLMHPKEAYHQHTGTGRLASLSLPNSEIIVGIDFTKNKRVQELLQDEKYFHMVLYPDSQAIFAKDKSIKENIEKEKKLLIFIIDATWFFAKKILRLSPCIKNLPKLSFANTYKSQFIFKHQPAEGYISTIESCYYLILELKEAGIIDKGIKAESLMEVFKKMVNFQLQAEQERIAAGIPGRHAYDAKRSKSTLPKNRQNIILQQ